MAGQRADGRAEQCTAASQYVGGPWLGWLSGEFDVLPAPDIYPELSSRRGSRLFPVGWSRALASCRAVKISGLLGTKAGARMHSRGGLSTAVAGWLRASHGSHSDGGWWKLEAPTLWGGWSEKGRGMCRGSACACPGIGVRGKGAARCSQYAVL